MLDTRYLDNPKVLKYLLPPSTLEEARKLSEKVYLNTLDLNSRGVSLFESNYLENKSLRLKIHKRNAFIVIRTKAIANGVDVKAQVIDGIETGEQLMMYLWNIIGHSPCIISKRKGTGVLCIDMLDNKGTICHIVVRSFDVDERIKREKRKGRQVDRYTEIKKLSERYSRHLNDMEGISMLTSTYTKAEL